MGSQISVTLTTIMTVSMTTMTAHPLTRVFLVLIQTKTGSTMMMMHFPMTLPSGRTQTEMESVTMPILTMTMMVGLIRTRSNVVANRLTRVRRL